MASHFSLSVVSLITLLLLLLSPTSAAPSPDTFSTVIGATYSAFTAATYPAPLTPEHLASAVASLNLAALRLDVSDPGIVRAFLYSNTTLLLTIPNALVPPLAANRSNAMQWLYAHVVPFFPRTKIAAISVGNDLLESAPEFSQFLLPAIQNVHLALLDIGIHEIAVSTTFSFVNVITTPFPPSAAQFQDAPLQTVVRPLLQFLRGTNSSFFVNLYPYNLYRLRSEIPIGFPLFQGHPSGFRDDMATGVRYRNLFDMMVDAVISAMAVAGHENIPIVVTETGWPSCSTDPREVEANPVYAELYLKGLLGHLKSGRGTPLRKEGLPQVFIYELIDKQVKQGRQWGILFPNMTKKYKNVDFSSDSDVLEISYPSIVWYVLILIIWGFGLFAFGMVFIYQSDSLSHIIVFRSGLYEFIVNRGKDTRGRRDYSEKGRQCSCFYSF